MAAVASGSAAAQVIFVASAPIITRLYGPEAYGIQGVFTSLVNILTTVACLSYPMAMALPKSDYEAIALGRLSILIGLALTLMLGVLLAIPGIDVLAFFRISSVSQFGLLLPLATFVAVVAYTVAQWLIRMKAFRITARFAVWTALIVTAAKMVLGFFHPTALALILSNILGGILGAGLTFVSWRRQVGVGTAQRDLAAPTRTLSELARLYADFPVWRTPQNLISTASQGAPTILLAIFVSAAAAGHYSIAAGFLAIPAGLIGGSVVAVFYPRINEAVRGGENIQRLILRATWVMAAVGLLPFLAIVMAGANFFELLFGEEWRRAGSYAQWLSIGFYFQYLTRPAIAALPALRLQAHLLVFEIAGGALKVSLLWLGLVVFESDVLGVALFAISLVVTNLLLIYWVLRRSARLTDTVYGS